MVVSRYKNLETLKTDKGKQYLTNSKDIDIPNRDDDVWIMWTNNITTRTLSYIYYKSEEYYWVILLANNKSIESQFILGQRIRIPKNINNIISQL